MSHAPVPERFERPLSYILIAGGVVFTGASAAAMLPPSLTGVGLLLVLLRVCWLDDNIKSDLIGATDLPVDYRRAAMEAPRLRPAEPLPDDPALIATGMRGQIQAWSAAALGALAVLVLTRSGWSATPALLGSMMLLSLSYWQADRLILTMLHLDQGLSLPPRALTRARAWAHSARVEPDEDR